MPPEFTVEELTQIKDRLIGYNYAILTQRFPKGMDWKIRQDVENFLVLKSKETDALVAKLTDVIDLKV